MGTRGVTYDLWLTLIQDVDGAATRDLRVREVAAVLSTSYDDAARLLDGVRAEQRAAWEARRAPTVPGLAAGLLLAAGRDTDAATVEAVVAAMEAPTTKAGVRLLPGAREVLTQVSARFPVALVCDTGMSSGRHLRRLLDDLGVLDAFTATVFSDEVRVPKPEAEPFRTALAALGVEPAAAVHVGDLKRRDVAGAAAVGMRAVRYAGARDDEPGEGPEATHVIKAHDEVLDLL